MQADWLSLVAFQVECMLGASAAAVAAASDNAAASITTLFPRMVLLPKFSPAAILGCHRNRVHSEPAAEWGHTIDHA
jgi:hypothetical protein